MSTLLLQLALVPRRAVPRRAGADGERAAPTVAASFARNVRLTASTSPESEEPTARASGRRGRRERPRLLAVGLDDAAGRADALRRAEGVGGGATRRGSGAGQTDARPVSARTRGR